MRVRTEKKVHKVTVTRGEDSATFDGSPLDPAENEKLRRKFTEHIKAKGQVLTDTDYLGLQLEKVRRVITGWDLEDEKGAKIKCTDEMKKTVYLLNPDLVNDALEKFEDIAKGVAEIEEKKKTT